MHRDERSSSLSLTNNCSLLQINFMAAKKKAKKAAKKTAKKKATKKRK
ncbi:MAG: hypothetical protein KBB54_01405 [Candidatus Pacebacteria bacterium]|nr:hypothetical protein [Candidatus Paceibacterota bacterium]MBP9818520.1 hypothetical protein [Candidatus Paceibacterota bacterium]